MASPENQKPNITVHDAVERDAKAISDLGCKTFADAFGFSLPEHELDKYLFHHYSASVIGSEIANTRDNKYFVAKIEGRIVGFLQFKFGSTESCLPPDTHTIEIRRVYVDSTRLSAGIGSVLMDHAMDFFDGYVKEARARGKDKVGIWLGVWEHNEKAQRFYARYGFEKIGQHGFDIAGRIDTDWIVFKMAP